MEPNQTPINPPKPPEEPIEQPAPTSIPDPAPTIPAPEQAITPTPEPTIPTTPEAAPLQQPPVAPVASPEPSISPQPVEQTPTAAPYSQTDAAIAAATQSTPAPTAVVMGGEEPVGVAPVAGTPSTPVSVSRKRPSKKLLLIAGAVFLVFGGAAAYYFGYYMNPSVVLSQSLKNTGKGYDKLVTYVDQQSKLYNKGYAGTGSYQVKSSSFSTDGKIAFKSDGSNSQLTFDIGAGVTRVNTDIRTIKSSGTTPDIYVKASGIKGLGTILGAPDVDASLAKLDSTWIVIDHTLIDNLGAAASGTGTATMQPPSREQILDEAKAFGKVNQQYVFSTAKDKSVTTVVKKYGVENVEGHKAYHYKVALQKDNVKKYILAQRDALKTSKLNTWLKDNKYDTEVYASFTDAANSTKDIKIRDTFDLWADVNNRMIYKLRFSDTKNPATMYTDVGLDYKGGDSLPFFIAGKSKDGDQSIDYSFITTVNTKSGNTSFKLNAKIGGSDGGTVTANFDLNPTSSTVKIDKPAGAKQLSQVLSELGFGDILSQYTQPATVGGVQSKAKDSKRQVDMSSLQVQLEAFFASEGYYPSLQDINSSAWLKTHMKSLDQAGLGDPDNANSRVLVASPAARVYAYKVTDDDGQDCGSDDTNCTRYTITATLSDGTQYSKKSLD